MLLPPNRLVRNETELATFRTTEMTVTKVHEMLKTSIGRLLINLPLGVGKSYLAKSLVDDQLACGRYDLLVYLAAQWRVLEEVPLVQEVSALSLGGRPDHPAAVLRGRPYRLCGDLDRKWRRYEVAGCSALGRKSLCGPCPNSADCCWPSQFSTDVLEGKRVVFGAQAYLSVLPQLLFLLATMTGAQRVLVVLDEPAFLDGPMRMFLSYDDMSTYRSVVAELLRRKKSVVLTRTLDVVDRLLQRRPLPPRQKVGRLSPGLLVSLQELGLDMFGQRFQFIGHELPLLPWCRWWSSPDGRGINYVRKPLLAQSDYIVIAADLPLEVARHRLAEPHIQEFCPGTEVLHEESKIYNLRSPIGAARNFRAHVSQITYAAAQLMLRLADQGKKTLLVVKKRFADETASAVERDLRELSGRRYRVIVNPHSAGEINGPLVVPLINFGVIGVNLYEHFDAAIALSSYNASPGVLSAMVNELHPPGEAVPVIFAPHKGRRVATTVGSVHQAQGFGDLARSFQAHLEDGVAKQALARVRYTIYPRLVIFMQSGDIGLPLEQEFTSLEALRQYFGLQTRRAARLQCLTDQVKRLRRAEMSPAQIAEELGIDIRTVYRRLK